MRTTLALLTLGLGFVAMPALAGEGRAEVHGGIAFGREGEETLGGDSEETVGVAAGYDFDLGRSGFIGIEVSADKVLVDRSEVSFGFSGRIGGRLGERDKLYAVGGYTLGLDQSSPHLGAGYEHLFGSAFYAKAEYRHFFTTDDNAVVAGIGVRF